MCIHVNTHTGGAVPIMNQYDTCQMVQKWFLVCWDVIYIEKEEEGAKNGQLLHGHERSCVPDLTCTS